MRYESESTASYCILLTLLPLSRSLCSTYPQGQVSIIPQLLTLLAAAASILVWPIFGYSLDFMCIETSAGSSGSTSYDCYPLVLNDPTYWSGSDSKGWAAAIQAAAIFAIFAAILGFMSFSLLATATCFVLEPRTILAVIIIQSLAAFFAILTLIAGAADVCKESGITTCNREKFHVETGAGFEICAFLLYLAALGVTSYWYHQVRQLDDPSTVNHPEEQTKALIDMSSTAIPHGDDEQAVEQRYTMQQSVPPLRSNPENEGTFRQQYMVQSTPPQAHTAVIRSNNPENEDTSQNHQYMVPSTPPQAHTADSRMTDNSQEDDPQTQTRHHRRHHRHHHRDRDAEEEWDEQA